MEQINAGILKLKNFAAGSYVNGTKMDFSAKREEPTFDALLEQKTNQARSEVVREKDRRPSTENETEQKEVKTEKTETEVKEEEENYDVAREAASSQIVWLMGQNNQDLLVTQQENVATIEQPMLIVVNDDPATETGELVIPQLTAETENDGELTVENFVLETDGELNAEQPELVQEIEQPEIETNIGGRDAKDADLEIRVTGDDTEEIGGDAAVEAPLFKDVEAAPIKVAEAPERTEENKPVEHQVTEKLSDALRSGETRVELQLEPLELGKLSIELTHDENGVLNILINAENEATRNLLERHINSLQESLIERGNSSVQITVERGEESQRQEQQRNDLQDDGNNRHNEQQRRDDQRSGDDFLQQLRLGLIPIEDEEED